ncbi:hypothetical protein CHS0354_010553 [Potamilus streckersoni]|uniref:Uncharacterized protein n=1 Tax=Potamilus streckersoni TaxID=2493646 RepID=A0AAE0VQ20_9BIVA|nr:hypothetical protein CHS0354_010553 [Potamilus streckersoni]
MVRKGTSQSHSHKFAALHLPISATRADTQYTKYQENQRQFTQRQRNPATAKPVKVDKDIFTSSNLKKIELRLYIIPQQRQPKPCSFLQEHNTQQDLSHSLMSKNFDLEATNTYVYK